MTTAVLPNVPTGYSESVWTALLRNPSALIGASMLALVLTLALLAGTLYPGDPLDMVAMPMLWPGDDPGYFLGSDSLGRDVAAGIAHGARGSLLIAASATLISVLIGGLVGGGLSSAQGLASVFWLAAACALVAVACAWRLRALDHPV